MLDLTLAIVHHVVIFAMFGVLAVEWMMVRPGMAMATVARLGRIDIGYGVLAGIILVVGFSRAIFAAKGWTYYSHNGFFWAKIATFAMLGLMSVPPTMKFIHWRRSATLPADVDIARVRSFLHVELGLFALLLAFAAAMARGYGQFA